MNRPDNISIREYLSGMVAEQLGISQDLVDIVVMDQFKQANKAVHSYNELEISGLGKFVQSQNKIRKRIQKATSIKIGTEIRLQRASSPEDIVRWSKRLETISQALQFYQSKLKPSETKGSLGRLEEQLVSTGEAERGDSSSVIQEDSNL